MRNLITILTIVAVTILAIATTADANFDTESEQHLRMNGLEIDFYTQNRPAYSWTSHYSGKTYWEEQQAYANLYFNIDQDFMNKYYQPLTTEIDVRRWNDNGEFNIQATFKMLVCDEEPTDWIAPAQINTNVNLWDINYYSQAEIRHQEIWNAPGVYETTENVQGSFGTGFENSTIILAGLHPSTYSQWDDGEEYTILEIRANIDFLYTGDNLALFNSSIEMVPEPLTLSLLVFGSFAALRRRTN